MNYFYFSLFAALIITCSKDFKNVAMNPCKKSHWVFCAVCN